MGSAETAQEQYNRLLFALSEGWCVEPPVYVRPSWSTNAEAGRTYHFVLRRGGDLALTSVQDNSVVRQLIDQHGWATSWLAGDLVAVYE